MAPGKMDIIQAATFGVDASAALIAGFGAVGIFGEELVENDFVRPGASDRKRVTNHGALRFTEEAKDFAEIVDKAGEDEPAGMAVVTNLLGGLEQVFELG